MGTDNMISMDEKKLKELALDVMETMRIAKKANPGIKKAETKYGKALIKSILAKREFKLDDFQKKDHKTIDDLKSTKYGPLVYEKDGRLFAKPEVSENIRIRYVAESPECFALAKLIRLECYKRGCSCMIIPDFEGTEKEYYENIPEDVLFELNPLSIATIKNIDASIYIGDESDPNWSQGFEKKIAMGAKSGLEFRAIYDKQKVRGALLAIPVKRTAGYVPEEKYRRIFWESLLASFSPEMKSLTKRYESMLKGKDKIRITADDGTDIEFSIKGRPVMRDDDFPPKEARPFREIYNFPTGEVFVAPLEYSANGVITFDYVTPHGFGLIENLKLTFKDGKVIDWDAKGDGKERFKRFLDTNTGEKDRIAELGIGCNPKAEFLGTTIVDEKIFGSIHIAIGFNQGAYHGKNMASSHLDMIKLMKGKGGNLYADGKQIMKDGLPVN